jgi:hypothetical protein
VQRGLRLVGGQWPRELKRDRHEELLENLSADHDRSGLEALT